MYHPSRGGCRGGRDQFDWEDVKGDKYKDFYLGHSLVTTNKPTFNCPKPNALWYKEGGQGQAADLKASMFFFLFFFLFSFFFFLFSFFFFLFPFFLFPFPFSLFPFPFSLFPFPFSLFPFPFSLFPFPFSLFPFSFLTLSFSPPFLPSPTKRRKPPSPSPRSSSQRNRHPSKKIRQK